MYELLPFWYAFWTKLGFAVHTSPVSSRGLYLAGQATIPSDTACFPAKLSHGHIKALSQMQLDAIFYPCLTYNVDEGLGDNHYNCPVVAYYPEVLAGNCPELEGKKFIYDYVGIHRPKDFVHKMAKNVLPKYFGGISEKEVQEAADAAYAEYEAHMAKIRVKGSEIIDEARRQGKRIIVLAGRPYHVDPEVNHGIDHLITRHGAAVVTEDSISNRVEKFPTSVLNQWTYHSRLYAAAKYMRPPRKTWIWCSWFPSAAAWTPLPPTRPARFCRRAASSTPSSRSMRSPTLARSTSACAACLPLLERASAMSDQGDIPMEHQLSKIYPGDEEDPYHPHPQHGRPPSSGC